MGMIEILKKMLHNYLLIYGGSVIATWIYCMIFEPNAVFELDYFTGMMLFAACGDLPTMVFYSRKKLTDRQWRMRSRIHLLLLLAVLLTMARVLKIYQNLWQGFILFVLILGVYFVINLFAYRSDQKTADAINEKIKEIKNET